MSIQSSSIALPDSVYQPLSQPNSESVLSRIGKRFTLRNTAILTIGISVIGVTAYLLTHGGATSKSDIFPHDGLFSYYCKEACGNLYSYNPELVKECDEYCEDSSKATFPKACTLACNKLGISLLLKCLQSCK